MHRDHVPEVPEGFLLLGSSPVSPVQGMVLPYPSSPRPLSPNSVHVFSVQGHPEFTASIVNPIIDARSTSGAMTPVTVAEGRVRAVREHDGPGVIGRTIWRILGV